MNTQSTTPKAATCAAVSSMADVWTPRRQHQPANVGSGACWLPQHRPEPVPPQPLGLRWADEQRVINADAGR